MLTLVSSVTDKCQQCILQLSNALPTAVGNKTSKGTIILIQ